MIITIKGADFSAKNIGTLSTWTILTTLGSGATYSGNRLVDKGGSLSATITISAGYELGSAGVSVIMGTTDVTSSVATVSGNTITISIATVTGKVTINVPTLITGEEIPNYAFTINPTPSNATVTLTASGYTQNGNSITVPNGTTVSWSVIDSGYTSQEGTWTISGGNKTENVVLVASGGDELAGTWLFNETISKENFGGKNGTVADLGVDVAAYRGYKVNYSIAPEGNTFNNSYEYLLAHKTANMIGYGYGYNAETNSISAGGIYQNDAFNRSVFRTINVYSNLSEVEDGDVLLAWFKTNAVKQ